MHLESSGCGEDGQFSARRYCFFGVGLVLYTIGSFIYFARHPKGFDAMFQIPFYINPFRSPPASPLGGFVRGIFTDPQSRWWCIIGVPIGLVGFVLLVANTVPLGQIAMTTAVFAIFFGVRELMARRRR
ncbi:MULTISPECIES: hypothetical protein [unclassified Mesorhizobium]|uniref:hypothetical protein n=1 Tax=unclassified Mesorhizobium TaxID=325217 RepID=UPI0012DF23D9|nr:MULTISPECIES: hypothetical protein [unclassified Mesorhizobium]